MSVNTLPNLEAELPAEELTPLPELSPDFIKEHTLKFENNGFSFSLGPVFYKRGEKRKSCSWYLGLNAAMHTAGDLIKFTGEDDSKSTLAASINRLCQTAFEENEDTTAGTYDRNGILAYLLRGPIRLKKSEILERWKTAADLCNRVMTDYLMKGVTISPGSAAAIEVTTHMKEAAKWKKMYDDKTRSRDDE